MAQNVKLIFNKKVPIAEMKFCTSALRHMHIMLQALGTTLKGGIKNVRPKIAVRSFAFLSYGRKVK